MANSPRPGTETVQTPLSREVLARLDQERHLLAAALRQPVGRAMMVRTLVIMGLERAAEMRAEVSAAIAQPIVQTVLPGVAPAAARPAPKRKQSA